MFSVVINGQKFTAFDWGYKKLIGQEGTFIYEDKIVEKNGKTYTNKLLDNLPKQKMNFATVDELKALELRVKILEDSLRVDLSEEEIGGHIEEDLPF